MSGNQFETLVQDTSGYMWFGANNGLNRFDGFNVKIYTTSLTDTNSILDNSIYQLISDSKGRLLIASPRGLCIYNHLTDNFSRIKSLGGITIRTLKEDLNGDFWIGTQSGELLLLSSDFQIKNKFIIEKNKSNTSKSNTIWSIFQDRNNVIWVGTQEGEIYSIQPNDTQLKWNLSTGYASIIMNMFEDKIGNLIICSMSGVSFYSNKTSKNGKIILEEIKNINSKFGGLKTVQKCFYGYDNNLWFIHEGGLSIYNETKNNLLHSSSPDFPFKIPFSSISNDVVTDKQGNIWVATRKDGIVLFNKMFKNFVPSNPFFSDKKVISLFRDSEGILWAGTDGQGVFCVSENNVKITNFSTSNSNSYGFDAKTVFCTFETSDHVLFLGTYQGLFQYNRRIGKFTKFEINPNNPLKLNHYDVRDLAEDLNGNLWIATNGGGVNILNRKSQTFSQLKVNEINPDSGLINNSCLKLFKDKKNNIWIGTYNGFSKYNPVSRHFSNFNNSKSNLLSHNWIFSFYEDEKENIWLATGNGLDVYNTKTNTFKYQFIKDGLTDNVVYSLLGGEKGEIWISTAKGLNKYDPVTDKIIAYSKVDGLSVMEFAQSCSFKSETGELFFGGTGGYISFFPQEIKSNPYLPKVFLTDLKLFYNRVSVSSGLNSILKQNISYTKDITLTYDQNIVTLEYIALNYLNPEKNQYAYQLVGFDDDWRYVGSKRDVTYTNLNPGDYIFRVKASNDDGIWNSHATEIAIHVIPPFWKTWWFQLFLFLFALSLTFGFISYRTNAVSEQNKRLEAAVDERTEKIRIQNQILEQQTNTLNVTNSLLEENQNRIEEQSEQLRTHLRNLAIANELLIEKQTQIELQSSALKEKNEALSKINSTKDKLFSILAHDLKAPFTTLLGFSDLVLKNFDVYPKEKVKHHIRNIRNSAYIAYELIDNLLNWSRTQRGNIEINLKPVDMITMLEDCLQTPRQQASRKEITIQIDYTGIERPVVADPDMLSIVIRNLTSNAIKYSYNQSTIFISVNFEPDFINFSIKDTGMGMNEETRSQLFEENNYHSQSGTSGEKGTGLGLRICSEFINRHGGKIWVESSPDAGSVFHFKLFNPEKDLVF